MMCSVIDIPISALSLFPASSVCVFPHQWEGKYTTRPLKGFALSLSRHPTWSNLYFSSGSWFQSGVPQTIDIQGSTMSNRGTCIASDGDKFLMREWVTKQFSPSVRCPVAGAVRLYSKDATSCRRRWRWKHLTKAAFNRFRWMILINVSNVWLLDVFTANGAIAASSSTRSTRMYCNTKKVSVKKRTILNRQPWQAVA